MLGRHTAEPKLPERRAHCRWATATVRPLSDQRATAVRRLNTAGVLVVAWLLRLREQGWYVTLDSALAAHRRYDEAGDRSREHRLEWDPVAFNLEPASRICGTSSSRPSGSACCARSWAA
jgi:hypothetical protein